MKLCIHTCVRLRALPTYHSYGTTVLLHGTTLPQFAASACTKPHYMKAELIKRKVKSQKRTPAMPKTRRGIHTLARHRIRTAVCHPSIRYGNINAASRTHRVFTLDTPFYIPLSPINTIRPCQQRHFSDALRLHARYTYCCVPAPPLLETAISTTPLLGRTAS